ncbi:MAG: murein L,D-transpeptidase [Alphaproteobacteria bacterium]|nr:MAG: murein L,D-transpeptidase [Alphaproteobacteria bacterium]
MSLPRRSPVFLCLLAAAALAIAGATAPARAESFDLHFSPFAQAVAEAALGDDEVAAFYRANRYQPIWTGADAGERARLAALLRALLDAPDHGLPVAAYDTSEVTGMMRHIASPRDRGKVEVALTHLFLTYAHDIETGIVEPRSIDPLMTRNPHRRDGTELLNAFLAAENPDAFLHSLMPQSEEYAHLMHKKLELEQQLARGGWGPTVNARKLEPGDRGAAVVALRNRLMAMGYLGRSATMTYDAEILKAVQEFQTDFGLNADGVAGPETIKALNVPMEERLKSVIVAMERERWLRIDRSRRYVWVNLADFTARIVDDGAITFETRSVIGMNAADRRTPEFSDEIEHMIINPTWHVPRSIVENEYLPSLIETAGAAAGHLQIIDGAGRVVPRESIDWTQVTAENFPFDLKQPPSGGNALGRVKFMFPNKHNIYLHDTPSKSLFRRDVRAFSHGCIRLQKPFEFAYTLLAPQVDDPVGYFQSILRTGQETQVDLVEHVPVHLVYRTAFSDLRGRVSFRNDIYGRDAKIWRALVEAGVRIPGLES